MLRPNAQPKRSSLARKNSMMKRSIAGEHAVNPKQPALGVIVIAHAPKDREHHEAEHDLEQLRRIHGDDRVGIIVGRERLT